MAEAFGQWQQSMSQQSSRRTTDAGSSSAMYPSAPLEPLLESPEAVPRPEPRSVPLTPAQPLGGEEDGGQESGEGSSPDAAESSPASQASLPENSWRKFCQDLVRPRLIDVKWGLVCACQVCMCKSFVEDGVLLQCFLNWSLNT